MSRVEHAESKDNYLFRFLVVLAVGLAAYGLAILHVAVWIFFACALPLLLLLFHFLIKPIFNETLTKKKLAIVKYLTFVVQNLLIVVFWFFAPVEWFSLLCLWVFRVNVLEVLIMLVKKKEYLLCVPTALMLVFSDLHFVKDPVFIVRMTDVTIFFIIEYTLWFIAWVALCYPARFIITIHTLYPIFLVPSLWYSVRTLTGMVTFTYTYIPWFFDNFMDTEKQKDQVYAFGRIYKPVYILVVAAMYTARFVFPSLQS